MKSGRRRALAPLDADRFLSWAHRHGDRTRGTFPLTAADAWFELASGDGSLAVETVRRWLVGLAARVRRNQRLGLDPWAGVV